MNLEHIATTVKLINYLDATTDSMNVKLCAVVNSLIYYLCDDGFTPTTQEQKQLIEDVINNIRREINYLKYKENNER